MVAIVNSGGKWPQESEEREYDERYIKESSMIERIDHEGQQRFYGNKVSVPEIWNSAIGETQQETIRKSLLDRRCNKRVEKCEIDNRKVSSDGSEWCEDT